MTRRYFYLCAVLGILALTFDAGRAELTEPGRRSLLAQAIGADQSKTVSVELELGLLQRTYKKVNADRERFVSSICSAILPLKGRDYARFIRLVRDETAALNQYGIVSQTPVKRSFQGYVIGEYEGRAFSCLEHDGENASAETQFDLFVIIQASTQRMAANPFKWLKKAAVGGHPPAQYVLAEQIRNVYHREKGVRAGIAREIAEESSAERYHDWLLKAAEAGVAVAQYDLGRFYIGDFIRTWGNVYIDHTKGLSWLKRAAKQDTGELVRNLAATRLGHFYFRRGQSDTDYVEAVRWYEQVDEKLMTPCSVNFRGVRANLITIYREGLGVKQDLDKAKYYAKVSTICE